MESCEEPHYSGVHGYVPLRSASVRDAGDRWLVAVVRARRPLFEDCFDCQCQEINATCGGGEEEEKNKN